MSSSQGFPIDVFVENYLLICNAPNGPTSCMAILTDKKNALATCCGENESKPIGYTCADGTVFCCNDPPEEQFNDGTLTDIVGYKGCLKAVPDYEVD